MEEWQEEIAKELGNKNPDGTPVPQINTAFTIAMRNKGYAMRQETREALEQILAAHEICKKQATEAGFSETQYETSGLLRKLKETYAVYLL